MPVVKDQRKVVLGLGFLPAIEDLVEHHKPHFIGQFEEFGCRRVVGGAQRIVAHPLEYLKLPLLCSVVEGCAQAPVVVMVALVMIVR